MFVRVCAAVHGVQGLQPAAHDADCLYPNPRLAREKSIHDEDHGVGRVCLGRGTLYGSPESELARIHPSVHDDACHVAECDNGRPFEVTEERVRTACLAHEGDARGRSNRRI